MSNTTALPNVPADRDFLALLATMTPRQIAREWRCVLRYQAGTMRGRADEIARTAAADFRRKAIERDRFEAADNDARELHIRADVLIAYVALDERREAAGIPPLGT